MYLVSRLDCRAHSDMQQRDDGNGEKSTKEAGDGKADERRSHGLERVNVEAVPLHPGTHHVGNNLFGCENPQRIEGRSREGREDDRDQDGWDRDEKRADHRHERA